MCLLNSKVKIKTQNKISLFFIFAPIKKKYVFFLSVQLFGNNALCKKSQKLQDKRMENRSTVSCHLMILGYIVREKLSICCPQVVSYFFFLQTFTKMLHHFYSLSSELGFFWKKMESLEQTEFSFDSENMWFKIYILFFPLNIREIFAKSDFGCASSLLYYIVEKDADIHNHTKCGLQKT